jgi:hypothetical protein
MTQSKIRYPRIRELGLLVYADPIDHIKWKELFSKLKIDEQELFNKYFGRQTCCESGPYAHDVEAVLERMLSGKLTGTQEYWD